MNRFNRESITIKGLNQDMDLASFKNEVMNLEFRYYIHQQNFKTFVVVLRKQSNT